jgi:hypothetical protein
MMLVLLPEVIKVVIQKRRIIKALKKGNKKNEKNFGITFGAEAQQIQKIEKPI